MKPIIEAYIRQFEPELREKLREIDCVVTAAAPQLVTRIAWGMPTYSIARANIIHFSVQKSFISLHVGVDAVRHFYEELAAYDTTKSVVHLGLRDEIPGSLIAEIVRYNLFRSN